MGLKWEVRELLQQGREEALANLAVTDPRALRPLIGRLWDPDREIRHRAARAIGRAAGVHHDHGLEIVRRLIWTLNDESTTNGVHALPALGEIGRHAPETIAPFIPALVAMMSDEGLRLELLRALGGIGESAPSRIAIHLDRLSRSIDEDCPEERRAFDRLVAITKEPHDVECD